MWFYLRYTFIPSSSESQTAVRQTRKFASFSHKVLGNIDLVQAGSPGIASVIRGKCWINVHRPTVSRHYKRIQSAQSFGVLPEAHGFSDGWSVRSLHNNYMTPTRIVKIRA